MRRLRLQDTIDDMDANIRESHDDLFAGIYIQHSPEYKVVVQFARTIPLNISQLIPKVLRSDVTLQKVRFSLNELEKVRSVSVELLKEKGIHVVSDIDTQNNKVLLSVDSSSVGKEFDSAESIEKYLVTSNPIMKGTLHVEMDSIFIDDLLNTSPKQLSPEDSYVRGGAMLRDASMNPMCTAGFTVAISGQENIRGLSTAGHCADNDPWDVKYYFTYIELHRENFIHQPPYDVAWHTPLGSWPITNQIDIENWGIRDIWHDKWRWAQHPGDIVCKYGRTSGPECGTIKSNSFMGKQVKTDIFVDGGDSGGPNWLGDTAYGTTVSQIQWREDTHWYVGSLYAPVDQLYNQLNVHPLLWR